jgi:hypothetical protein
MNLTLNTDYTDYIAYLDQDYQPVRTKISKQRTNVSDDTKKQKKQQQKLREQQRKAKRGSF